MNETPVSSGTGPRKRRTQTERAQLLEAYRGSGLSRAEFCRERGVHYTTLSAWLRKEKSSASQSDRAGGGRWMKAEVSPLTWLGAAGTVAEVELVGGVRVRLMSGCEATMVGTVLEAAARCGR